MTQSKIHPAVDPNSSEFDKEVNYALEHEKWERAHPQWNQEKIDTFVPILKLYQETYWNQEKIDAFEEFKAQETKQ